MLRDMWFSVQSWHYVTGMGNILLRLRELYENRRVASKHPKRMSGVL